MFRIRDYITLIVIFTVQCSWAQSTFTWESGVDSMKVTIVGTEYVELKMYQINESGDTLNLGIEVVERDIPSDWDGMLCLYGKCLGSVPDIGFTETMNGLIGDEKGYVRWTVNGKDTESSALLRVRVYDLEDEAISDTATWIVNSIKDTTTETSSILELNKNEIDLYPNPSNGIVQFSSSKLFNQIDVYNIQGSKVFSSYVTDYQNGQFNLRGLNGINFVYLRHDGNIVAVRKLIVNE
jgi:hypothetical protein